MAELRRATVKQLAYKIKGLDQRKERSPRFAFFLGAGASFQSGISTASGMISDFKKRIIDAQCPPEHKTDEQKEQWLTSQPWYASDNLYSALFEQWEPKEIGRQRYIEEMIEGRTPSFGYVALANLMASNYINSIITTNFDDLIYSACTTYTEIRPIVYAYGVMASEMRITARRPKILKLHGDYLYSALKNTDRETAAQDQNMARQVLQVLNEYGLVVVGYSGSDKSIMDVLAQISEKNDLYWCVHRGSQPNAAVEKLLRDKGGFLIEIDGFDELMNEIRNVVGFDARAMIGSIQKRQEQIIESLKKFSPNYTIDILRDIVDVNKEQAQQQDTTARLEPHINAVDYFVQAYEASEAGDFAKAETLYRGALAQDPNDATAHNNLGWLLDEKLGKPEEAETHYRKAVELDPNFALAYNNLGWLLYNRMKRVPEAELLLRQAIQLDPTLALAYNNLGVLLDALHRTREAETMYRRATELDPNDSKPWFNLGLMLANDPARASEAEAAYRRALELEPNQPDRYSGLVTLLRSQERAQEAIALLERWLALDPQNFRALLALAAIHRELGDSQQAQAEIAQARPLIGAEDWYNLACLESIAGNADRAIAHLRRAAENPEFDRAWAQQDPDLQWVRDDPRFQQIVGG